LSETNEKRVTSDIDVDFLDPAMFGPPRVAAQSCTGTGKTTSVVIHAKSTGNPILSVVFSTAMRTFLADLHLA